MKINFTRHGFFLTTGLFLSLALISSLPAFVTLGNSSTNTVNVNARIQSSQMLEVEGQVSGDSSSKSFTPVKFGDLKKQKGGKHVATGSISLNLGSNTEWELFARVTNLEETRNSLKDSGWKLEGFILRLDRGKTRMAETHGKLASGSYGKHKLEASFKVTISPKGSSSIGSPPLDGLENVIVFALR